MLVNVAGGPWLGLTHEEAETRMFWHLVLEFQRVHNAALVLFDGEQATGGFEMPARQSGSDYCHHRLGGIR